MTLSLNNDGSLIAAIYEEESDNKNKQYFIEVYDFNYDDPYQSPQTLYSMKFQQEKECLSWNPKRNVLAFGGGDKDTALLHILTPTQGAVPSLTYASLM